jgi:hypothetical protein
VIKQNLSNKRAKKFFLQERRADLLGIYLNYNIIDEKTELLKYSKKNEIKWQKNLILLKKRFTNHKMEFIKSKIKMQAVIIRAVIIILEVKINMSLKQ